MTTLADLEAAIDVTLNHPLGLGHYQLIRRVEEKAYEAYVFGLCLDAARGLGATVTLCGISGSPNPFIFRGGPGEIHSQRRNYGYAEFALAGQAFEVHAGVEFQGTSGMRHEIDVAIIRGADAAKCRAQPDDPPAASLVAGWECKFYTRQLDKGLGRAFVGLIADMGRNYRGAGMCSNQTHPQLNDYFRPKERPHPHFSLTPLNQGNELVFVNQIRAALKKLTGT